MFMGCANHGERSEHWQADFLVFVAAFLGFAHFDSSRLGLPSPNGR
jgi:hypothetical protein